MSMIDILGSVLSSSDNGDDKLLYTPIPPRDFFLSEYHCGFPSNMIPKFWLDEACDFIEGGYNELIITGSLGCLNKNTRIATTKGLLKLEDINSTDEYYVQSESGLRKVIHKHDNGVHDTIKVTLSNGDIVEGTYNHKFRIVRNGEIIWSRLDGVVTGDYFVKQMQELPFGTVSVSKEKAYLLGYLLGDGWIGYDKEHVLCDIGVVYTELEVDSILKEGFVQWFGKYWERTDSRTVGQGGKLQYLLNITRRKEARYLLEQGFGHGARNKNIPEFVYTWDKDSIRWLLAGLFDSDGTVSDRDISLCTTSTILAKSVSDLLALFGIRYKIGNYDSTYKNEQYLFHHVTVNGINSIKKFQDNIPLQLGYKRNLLFNINTELNKNTRTKVPFAGDVLRKMDSEIRLSYLGPDLRGWQNRSNAVYNENVCKEVLNKIYLYDRRWLSKSEYLTYTIEKDCEFLEVINLEKTQCYTMDIAVEDDPSYLVNGLVSHNSFKTTWANLITMYKLYDLFSHSSIHEYFVLPKIQEIYNIYFNVTLTQAQLTGYGQLKNMLDSSKWFNENFARNKEINSIIKFPRQDKLFFLSGSNASHAIGMTVWCFILDEGDFFKKNGTGFDESYSAVTGMYTELCDRRASRFKKKDSDYSFSMLISSASFQSSFVEKRIAESAKDPKIKVVKAINYKVVPERYSDKSFVVFTGDAQADPELINTTHDIKNILLKTGFNVDIDSTLEPVEAYNRLHPTLKQKFETPPVDLIKHFETNLGKALQNFCGVYIAAEGKLFQSKQLLFSAYKEHEHPFSKQKIELSTGDTVQLKDYLLTYMLKDLQKPHAVHLDGSVNGDSYGFGIVRYDGTKDNKRYFTQVMSLEIVPPPPPFRIKLSKVRDFLIYLKNTLGMNIVKLTQDGHQSEDNLQLLADAGFNVARQSIDSSDKTYLAWISLLVDGCVSHYKYQVLEDEAFAAIHYPRKKKVDHPQTGNVNINVLQAFVGALWNLVSMEWDNISHVEGYTLPENMITFDKHKVTDELLRTGVMSNNVVGDLARMKQRGNILTAIM